MVIRKQKASIKKIIKKRIEINQKNNINFINKNRYVMNDRDSMRIFGNSQKKMSDIVSTTNQQSTLIKKNVEISETYRKKMRVDFDFVFCVSSFDRYEKINRILSQLFSQNTKYSFKFILMNDGSTDLKYNDLQYKYPDILYLKNDINGGKLNYWKTLNTLWGAAKNIEAHAIIQIDDDFVLCNGFLDKLGNTFFKKKKEDNRYMVVNYHLYNFKKNAEIESWWFDENEKFVDGGMLIDVQFLDIVDYKLDMRNYRILKNSSSFVWVWLKDRLIEYNLKVYRTKNSLVWHDGNEDSKLHPLVRKSKRVYTKNFIDDNGIYETQ